MESTTRAVWGLRVRLKTTSPKNPIIKSNGERCREYRSALKADPERYAMECLKNQARNRKNRQRPHTEEEKSRRKETNRLRQQECRARKKAAQLELAQQTPSSVKVPTAGKCSTRSKLKEEEGALQMQQQKWAEAKRKERQQWTAQKRRRDREKALQRYYQRKAAVQTDTTESTDTVDLTVTNAEDGTPASDEDITALGPLPVEKEAKRRRRDRQNEKPQWFKKHKKKQEELMERLVFAVEKQNHLLESLLQKL